MARNRCVLRSWIIAKTFVASLLLGYPAFGASLVWEPNAESNLAGYKLYRGTASRQYTSVVDVGKRTQCELTNLVQGATCFFALTAYNTAGLESGFSTEVVYTPTAVNTPPVIATFGPRATSEDTSTGPITFTIGDAETPGSLTLGAVSSNLSLVPTANMTIGGTGTNRTLTISPALDQSGTATITVSVSDGQLSASSSFLLTVNAVNDTPTIANIADRTVDQNTSTGPIGFVIGDVETAASSLSLTASSSNPSLVPIQNIAFGGSGSSRTVNVSPATNQTGTATISITVSDGAGTATDTFVLTVRSIATTNAPPLLSSVRSTTIFPGGSSLPMRFSVSDAETPTEALQVWAVSSNPSLIPDGNVAFQGSGTNRTLTITANNGTGNATMTLSVSDGSGNTRSTNFGVNVVSRPASLVYLPFEAENGLIVAPMQPYTDSSATYVATTTANEGSVSFQFSITNTGNYVIWARHLSPDNARDSFSVSVNGVEITYPTAIGTWSPDWQWTRVTASGGGTTQDPRVLSLSAGTHTVVFRGSERNCGLDRIIVCNDLEFVPGINAPVTPANKPPVISGLTDRAVDEDTGTATIPFTIFDAETPNALVVSLGSSNPSLVPTANMTIGGTGTNRTLTISPALDQSGTAAITVSVSDGQLSASSSFLLTVNAVNDTPTIANIADRTVDQNTSTGPIGFVIGDVETAASSLSLTASSSNPSLVPIQNIAFGGSGSSRTVNVSPATNQTGTATISITVSDGAGTATDTFVLTVRSIATTNAPPLLSSVRSTTIFPGGSSLPMRFSVSDAETPTEALQVWAVSSNPSLIPDGNVAFQGSGTNRTLTVTANDGIGDATITLSVSDGSGGTRSTNFGLTVVARPSRLVYLPFEAEEGSIVSPMRLYTKSGVTYAASTSRDQGNVSFEFSVAEAGNYIIWARHLSPDNSRDSFFVSIDGIEVPYATAIGTWSSDWQWTRVTASGDGITQDPRVLSLSAGTHTIAFRGSERQCGLDRIIVCNDLEFEPDAVAPFAAAASDVEEVGASAEISTVQEEVAVVWESTPGLTYKVQGRHGLMDSWQDVSPPIVAEDFETSWIVPESSTSFQFYRVVLLE